MLSKDVLSLPDTYASLAERLSVACRDRAGILARGIPEGDLPAFIDASIQVLDAVEVMRKANHVLVKETKHVRSALSDELQRQAGRDSRAEGRGSGKFKAFILYTELFEEFLADEDWTISRSLLKLKREIHLRRIDDVRERESEIRDEVLSRFKKILEERYLNDFRRLARIAQVVTRKDLALFESEEPDDPFAIFLKFLVVAKVYSAWLVEFEQGRGDIHALGKEGRLPAGLIARVRTAFDSARHPVQARIVWALAAHLHDPDSLEVDRNLLGSGTVDGIRGESGERYYCLEEILSMLYGVVSSFAKESGSSQGFTEAYRKLVDYFIKLYTEHALQARGSYSDGRIEEIKKHCYRHEF